MVPSSNLSVLACFVGAAALVTAETAVAPFKAVSGIKNALKSLKLGGPA